MPHKRTGGRLNPANSEVSHYIRGAFTYVMRQLCRRFHLISPPPLHIIGHVPDFLFSPSHENRLFFDSLGGRYGMKLKCLHGFRDQFSLVRYTSLRGPTMERGKIERPAGQIVVTARGGSARRSLLGRLARCERCAGRSAAVCSSTSKFRSALTRHPLHHECVICLSLLVFVCLDARNTRRSVNPIVKQLQHK